MIPFFQYRASNNEETSTFYVFNTFKTKWLCITLLLLLLIIIMIISANKKSATYIQTNNNPNPPTTIPISAASKAWQKKV